MGCHTWFYKKSELTLDECIHQAKNKMREGLVWSSVYLLDISGHVEIDGGNHPFSEKELKDWDKYNTRVLSWLEKGWIRDAAYNLLGDGMYFRGNYYVDCGEFHDLFRLGGYPEDILLSLDETLNFIENNKANIHLYDYSIEKLKLFWEKYPNGNIHFG